MSDGRAGRSVANTNKRTRINVSASLIFFGVVSFAVLSNIGCTFSTKLPEEGSGPFTCLTPQDKERCAALTTNSCQPYVCNSVTNFCELSNAALPVGTPCDDGDLCTVSDTCQESSVCEGVAVNCTSTAPCRVGVCTGNVDLPCTENISLEGSACSVVTACSASLGNGSCDATGACVPNQSCGCSGIGDCESYDTPCYDYECDTEAFECVLSSQFECPQTGPCSNSVCVVQDAQALCVEESLSEGAPCSLGDECNVSTCTNGDCFVSGAVSCNDENECTADACDSILGCVFEDQEDDAPCDDGDSCTGDDHCRSGVCVSSLNLCSQECEEQGSDGAQCDTGNPCVPGLCDQGICESVAAELFADASDCACVQDQDCSVFGSCNDPSVARYVCSDSGCAVAPCCGDQEVGVGEYCDPTQQVPHCDYFECVPADFGPSVVTDTLKRIDHVASQDGYTVVWEATGQSTIVYRSYTDLGPEGAPVEVINNTSLMVPKTWDVAGGATTPAVLAYARASIEGSDELVLKLRTLKTPNEVELWKMSGNSGNRTFSDVQLRVFGSPDSGYILSTWIVRDSSDKSSAIYRSLHSYSCANVQCVPGTAVITPSLIHSHYVTEQGGHAHIQDPSVSIQASNGAGIGGSGYDAWVAFTYSHDGLNTALIGGDNLELVMLRKVHVLGLGEGVTTSTTSQTVFGEQSPGSSGRYDHPVLSCFEGEPGGPCLLAARRKSLNTEELVARLVDPVDLTPLGETLVVEPEGDFGSVLEELRATKGAPVADGSCGFILGWIDGIAPNNKESYLARLSCTADNILSLEGMRSLSPAPGESVNGLQLLCGGLEQGVDRCAAIFLGNNETQLKGFIFPSFWVP